MAAPLTQTPTSCFIALPRIELNGAVRDTITQCVREAKLTIATLPQTKTSAWVERVIAETIAKADCLVADITTSDPQVYLELGLARALGKTTFVITQEKILAPLLASMEVIQYTPSPGGLAQLRRSLGASLRKFKRFPLGNRALSTRMRSLFAVDWDRLNREDFENLCMELLAQLGYRKLQWQNRSHEIDLTAELPKRDPDGYEYKEQWYISLSRNAPVAAQLDMIMQDPDYFAHRILRRPDRVNSLLRKEASEPVTFLAISVDESLRHRSLFEEDGKVRRNRDQGPLRFRFWDRNYLTNLIYQFPPIGFKYFSDEGRSESKFRKTPEQLYEENLVLTKNLIQETDRRIRAERDAVWKDISFSAAHKMGNPIFAIETNLDPLVRRIEENRIEDATDVIKDIKASVEKAKFIISEFKSLASLKASNRKDIKLKPILDAACKLIQAEPVYSSVDCNPDLVVYGDADQLAECFDELVCNALRWFDKEPRSISIKASALEPGEIPEGLDSKHEYVVVHVVDNGKGVPLADKSKIFDAFYTTHAHGTGLGLSMVRRILTNHGGLISETGKPGTGADFEIYLPQPNTVNLFINETDINPSEEVKEDV